MKILFVSYEVYPLAKVGGLADVAGSLPKYLEKEGVRVQIAMPFHKKLKADFIENTGLVITTKHLPEKYSFEIYKTSLPGSSAPVFLFKNDQLIDSEEVYGGTDLALQAIAFSDAVVKFAETLEPDLLHVNDWQPALIPAYIGAFYDGKPKTLLTIHNLGYQGEFDKDYFHKTGLPEKLWEEGKAVKNGAFNFLKTGIVTASAISTVSPTYAKEIQTPEYGAGLDETLRPLKDRLFGILNGIDYSEYNPATDKRIPVNFDINSLEKKRQNKIALQKELGLPITDVPVIGLISRLVEQKGFDLIEAAAEKILGNDLQFVVLGTGEERYERLFKSLDERFPEKVSANITFNVDLAQKIYAGSDMFLMPSRYEPCGLGQMFAMRYGTIPVVRFTGGLRDTVREFNPETLEGNGFGFEEYNPDELIRAIERAIKIYENNALWKQLMSNAMNTDCSWDKSAREYIKLYKHVLNSGRDTLNA